MMLPTKFRFIWPSGFRGEDFFRNRPTRNKNCLFVNGSGLNGQFHRGPSIDASYQFSIHLVKRFHRRRFLEINQSETRIACGGHVC